MLLVQTRGMVARRLWVGLLTVTHLLLLHSAIGAEYSVFITGNEADASDSPVMIVGRIQDGEAVDVYQAQSLRVSRDDSRVVLRLRDGERTRSVLGPTTRDSQELQARIRFDRTRILLSSRRDRILFQGRRLTPDAFFEAWAAAKRSGRSERSAHPMDRVIRQHAE